MGTAKNYRVGSGIGYPSGTAHHDPDTDDCDNDEVTDKNDYEDDEVTDSLTRTTMRTTNPLTRTTMRTMRSLTRTTMRTTKLSPGASANNAAVREMSVASKETPFN